MTSKYDTLRLEALPNPVAEPRTYRVEYRRDLTGYGLHWRLYTYGPGHWCVGSGHAGSFKSETEAHSIGRQWLETGTTARKP